MTNATSSFRIVFRSNFLRRIFYGKKSKCSRRFGWKQDEYAHSEYTAFLKGANAKAKANAAQGVPELIEIATGMEYRENTKEKHSKDAKFGWYRYDSRFALPVYKDSGEIAGYNVFNVIMVVRHAQDGKLYLYDIVNIKKETSNLFQS